MSFHLRAVWNATRNGKKRRNIATLSARVYVRVHERQKEEKCGEKWLAPSGVCISEGSAF